MSERLKQYGGQALIEGVLMRSRNNLVAAFRLPDGSITLKSEKIKTIKYSWFWDKPGARGLRVLADSLLLGTKYLGISASLQNEDEEVMNSGQIALTMVLSLLLSLGLFFLLPAMIAEALKYWLGFNAWVLSLLEGSIRLAIFIGYLVLIGRLGEIQKVFAYHGAEHKTINAFESSANMDVEHVSAFSTAHQRCGTSFLLTLVFLSILLFSFLVPLPLIQRLILRIAFIPLLAGLSYEMIRWMGNHSNFPLVKLLSKPNLALQKLTTREPTKEMIEVALSAFNYLLKLETLQ